MADYKEFLDSINRREAYHEGECQWEEDGYTVTRTYHYSPSGLPQLVRRCCCTSRTARWRRWRATRSTRATNGKLCMRCLEPARSGEPPRPPEVSHEARRRARREQVGTHQLGRGLRRSSSARCASVWGDVRRRMPSCCMHGTGRNIDWQLPILRQCSLEDAEHVHVRLHRLCVLPAAHLRMHRAYGRLPDCRRLRGARRPLRQSRVAWRPTCIVVWGNEPLASNADGYMGHWLAQCVQMGSKIISIDPRLTWWGARAEYWLPRPSRHRRARLACAWLNVIINEDLYDHEFVDCWCAGFDELAASRAGVPRPNGPPRSAGVPAEDVVGSARLYATAQARRHPVGPRFRPAAFAPCH